MKVRLKYLSYPRVQLVIVFAFLISMLLFSAIVLFFLTSAMSKLVDLGKVANLPQNHIYYQFLQMQTKSILLGLVYAFFVMSLFGTIFFIWFSHSLVGPIVALIEHLKKCRDQFRSGEPIKPIKFRKSDHFQDLAKLINENLSLATINNPRFLTQAKSDDP
ncbi:MAG: hypothetical protein K1X29_10380 [Bdellovibrionales bacterium]|nr:hypothetical protein [Bdellovibrionales bacterium]